MGLSITGSQAIDMIKSEYPKTWQDLVCKKIGQVKTAMRIYKADALTSYQKYMNQTQDRENAIAGLASDGPQARHGDDRQHAHRLPRLRLAGFRPRLEDGA